MARFPEAEADTRDGLHLSWEDGWLHVRPSNTEPILRILAEAGDEAVYDSRGCRNRSGAVDLNRDTAAAVVSASVICPFVCQIDRIVRIGIDGKRISRIRHPNDIRPRNIIQLMGAVCKIDRFEIGKGGIGACEIDIDPLFEHQLVASRHTSQSRRCTSGLARTGFRSLVQTVTNTITGRPFLCTGGMCTGLRLE